MRILHISTRLILGGSQENTVLSCEGQARLGHDVHLAFGPIYGPEGSLLERVQGFGKNDEATERPSDGGGKAKETEGREERGDGGKETWAGSPCHEEGARAGSSCDGITTHVVPHLVRAVSPRADELCYRELRRLVKRLRPDIVHTHSSKAGIIGRAAAWDEVYQVPYVGSIIDFAGGAFRARQPLWTCGIVHTIHGPPFMPVEGSFARRMKVRANNFVYTVAERFAAKRCHVIVSVADAMTKQFLARKIGRPEQYETVYSGMEVEPFLSARPGEDRAAARAALGLGEKDFVIGTVARLAQHKGHDDVLDALGEDLKRRPEWKLLWVGDGWWRERLVRRAREIGLGVAALDGGAKGGDARSAQVILTGLVPPERIPMMMRAMDVLVHPSYREGLPRTVPQALLCGVCPIAYDCDGTPEVIRNYETGLSVPTGDRARLREAVVWAHDHPAERAAMGLRGREECRVKFSAETMVAELEKVYAKARGG